MDNLYRYFNGITPMCIVVCIEIIIVILAMSVDFASGFYKAKLRGEVRTSLGMKRTISKFILYVGSVMIAFGMDSIFYMCGFWRVVHVALLEEVCVITSVVAVFICAIEIHSIWEKAEDKHRKDALKTANTLLKLLTNENVEAKLNVLINGMRDDEQKKED